MTESRSIESTIKEGHYARKQLRGGLDLISWSHRRRFETALSLAENLGGEALLDYGCGDGTFLGMVHDRLSKHGRLAGAEIKRELVEDCRNRLASHEGLQFLSVDRLTGPKHTSRYDVIFCMEVLEHVVEVAAVLGHIHGLLSPSGKLIVSVPVETGPALLIKLLLRRLAAFRGCADYPGSDPYTIAEIFASSLKSVGHFWFGEVA